MLLLLTAGVSLPDRASAQVLYTDLDTAPPGAPVGVYGLDFGEEAGELRLEGRRIDVLLWSDRKIVFRMPGGESRRLRLQVIPRDGATPHEFEIGRHSGRVFLIGDRPSAAALGQAWLGESTGAERRLRGIGTFLRKARPGDVGILLGGDYRELMDPVYDAHVFIEAKHSGRKGRPIALVAYPGQRAVVGSGEHRYGVFFFNNVTDWTIAGLELRGKAGALAFSPMGVRERIRIVDNLAREQRNRNGVFQFNSTYALEVLGNRLLAGGIEGDKFSHLMYYGGFGPGGDVTFAWNTLQGQRGGRCLQVYGHRPNDELRRLRIIGNRVSECRLDGVLIGGSDAAGGGGWIDDVVVAGNLIHAVGGAGVRLNDPGMRVRVEDNVIFDAELAILAQRARELRIEENVLAGRRAASRRMEVGLWEARRNTYASGPLPADEPEARTLQGTLRELRSLAKGLWPLGERRGGLRLLPGEPQTR